MFNMSVKTLFCLSILLFGSSICMAIGPETDENYKNLEISSRIFIVKKSTHCKTLTDFKIMLDREYNEYGFSEISYESYKGVLLSEDDSESKHPTTQIDGGKSKKDQTTPLVAQDTDEKSKDEKKTLSVAKDTGSKTKKETNTSSAMKDANGKDQNDATTSTTSQDDSSKAKKDTIMSSAANDTESKITEETTTTATTKDTDSKSQKDATQPSTAQDAANKIKDDKKQNGKTKISNNKKKKINPFFIISQKDILFLKYLNSKNYHVFLSSKNVDTSMLFFRFPSGDKLNNNYCIEYISGVYSHKNAKTYPLSNYSIFENKVEGKYNESIKIKDLKAASSLWKLKSKSYNLEKVKRENINFRKYDILESMGKVNVLDLAYNLRRLNIMKEVHPIRLKKYY